MHHLGTQPLRTERLLLRPFTVDDAHAMYCNWASDPLVTSFLTWPTHSDETVTRAYLTQVAEGYAQPERYQWGMQLLESGELIGTIAVVGDTPATCSADIGYCMGRAWWGQGLMAEALCAVRDFLFDHVGYLRLTAGHDVENPRSGRVMEKAGMRKIGVVRRGGTNNRGVVDIVLYDMLPEDRRP